MVRSYSTMSSSSNIFWKNFINLCFPNKSPSSAAAALTHSLDHTSTTRPDHSNQTLKTAATQNNNNDRQLMMVKTFNTVYDDQTTTTTTSTSKSITTATDDDFLFTSSSDDFSDQHPDLDLASVFASQRFFFSSPGHSKSLIHSSSSSTPTTPPPNKIRSSKSGPLLHIAGGVPVPKYSPDPYSDFRSSMREMIEARASTDDPKQNWESYLHELLTCYLSLNPTSTHDCIIKAFSDLVVDFVLSKHNADTGPRDPADVFCRPSDSRRLL